MKSTSVLENGLRELSRDVRDVWLAREDDVIVAVVLTRCPSGAPSRTSWRTVRFRGSSADHGVRDGLQG